MRRHRRVTSDLTWDVAFVVVDPRIDRATRRMLARYHRRLATVDERSFAWAQFLLCINVIAVVSVVLVSVVLRPHGTALLGVVLASGALGVSALVGAGAMVRTRATARRHRQGCVLIGDDLDGEGWHSWERVLTALDVIQYSQVYWEQRIDTTRFTAELPDFLWNVAKPLADLVALRQRQHEALQGVDANHPDLAPVMAPQRAIQERTAAEVETRVRGIERFAELVREADAALDRQAAALRLAALNHPHLELHAQNGPPPQDDLFGMLSGEARAVVEQAQEAIRRANDAGLGLFVPAQADRPVS